MTFQVHQLGEIVDQGGRMTVAELRSAIRIRRNELVAEGCREGTVVALVQPNEADFFVSLFALWELGACVVPLSPLATAPEIEHVFQRAGCSMARHHGRMVRLPGKEMLPGTALLLYTSGSTGAPKGVMLSYQAVRSKLDTLAAVQPAEVLARTLCLLPVSFGHGLIGNSLPTLLAGGVLHLQPSFSSALAAKLGEFVDANSITFLSSVPAVWTSVLPFADPPRGGSLRRVFCASAALSVEAWREAKQWLGGDVDFRNVYGITEAASWISSVPEGESYGESGLIGPGWNCQFRVEPATGEVLVRAPYLMSGYHNDPESTAASFVDGWLRTGDTGSLDPAQGLRLLGRLKDQINRAGQKISPAEVEECLLRHPSVRDCCVFGLPDPVAGEAVVAAVVVGGPEPAASDLKSHCRRFLSEYKVPEKFFFVASIPRTGRGKVNRVEVAAVCGNGRA